MYTVKILGMGDPFYHSLKMRLEEALRELDLNAVVEEITDVDTILNHKISSIPSILVREKEMRLGGTLPEVSESMHYLKKEFRESRRMKKILVPVDFFFFLSNAMRFAVEIASQNSAKIEVVHIAVPHGNLDSYLTPELQSKYDGDRKDLLQTFVEKETGISLKEKGQVSIRTKIIEGYPAEELVQRSKDSKLNLIIMGTTGRNTVLEKLFGSISTHVAKNAWSPVLLIPENATYTGFKSILCASNHFAIDEVMMRKMINFANLFDAEVSMLKVNEQKGTEYKVIKREYEESFLLGGESISCQLTLVGCEDVVDGIIRYSKEMQPDLLVLFTIHRTLIESIFHKSVTKKVMNKLDLPILIMHYDD